MTTSNHLTKAVEAENPALISALVCADFFKKSYPERGEAWANGSWDKEQFIGELAHALKKPLHYIVTSSSICKEEILGELNKEQMEYLALIQDSGEVMLKNIDEILQIVEKLT